MPDDDKSSADMSSYASADPTYDSTSPAKPSMADLRQAPRTMPLPDPQTTHTGIASYYGNELKGKKTASGEKFNPNELTAAHRTLPLGSQARVTDLDTGKKVTVRINDRGPYVGNRVMDLSRGAAKALGSLGKGTAHVGIEPLRRKGK